MCAGPGPKPSPRAPSSPEELARRDRFTSLTFRFLVGREPSDSDRTVWRAAAAHESDLAFAAAVSAEAQARLAATWIPQALGARSPALESAFNASVAGRAHPRRELRLMLIRSNELWKRCGESRAAFVSAAHQIALGRKPTPAEQSGWELALERGASQDRLAQSLVMSEQGSRAAARWAFREVLGRDPDAGMEGHMVNAMAGGLPEEALIANLLVTPESMGRGPREPQLPPPVDVSVRPR